MLFTEIKNSFYRKAQQRLKEICLVKQRPQEQPQKSHKQDVLQLKHLQIDQSVFASHRMHAMKITQTGCSTITVEPLSTDTRLIQTPALYGQFRLSQQKAHIFSLKLTCFIQTPANTHNGHFSVSRVTNSHI